MWSMEPQSPSSGFLLTLSIQIAQKPYIIGSLGPNLRTESFEGKGKGFNLSYYNTETKLFITDLHSGSLKAKPEPSHVRVSREASAYLFRG